MAKPPTPQTPEAGPRDRASFEDLKARLETIDRALDAAQTTWESRLAEVHERLAETQRRQDAAERKLAAMRQLVDG